MSATLEREIKLRFQSPDAARAALLTIGATPRGTFVEIEGGEGGIAAAAESLGRGPVDYLLDSYRALFTRYCAEHRHAGTHMLFAAD